MEQPYIMSVIKISFAASSARHSVNNTGSATPPLDFLIFDYCAGTDVAAVCYGLLLFADFFCSKYAANQKFLSKNFKSSKRNCIFAEYILNVKSYLFPGLSLCFRSLSLKLLTTKK